MCVNGPSGTDDEIYCQSPAGGPQSGTSTGVMVLKSIRYTAYTVSDVPYYFPDWGYPEPTTTNGQAGCRRTIIW